MQSSYRHHEKMHHNLPVFECFPMVFWLWMDHPAVSGESHHGMALIRQSDVQENQDEDTPSGLSDMLWGLCRALGEWLSDMRCEIWRRNPWMRTTALISCFCISCDYDSVYKSLAGGYSGAVSQVRPLRQFMNAALEGSRIIDAILGTMTHVAQSHLLRDNRHFAQQDHQLRRKSAYCAIACHGRVPFLAKNWLTLKFLLTMCAS